MEILLASVLWKKKTDAKITTAEAMNLDGKRPEVTSSTGSS
jgi:hypothetical protein